MKIQIGSHGEGTRKLRKNRALVAGSLEAMKVAIKWVPSS